MYQAYTPASKYLTGAADMIAVGSPDLKKIAIVHENDKFSTDVATERSAFTALHLREPVPRSYDLFVALARDALVAAREEPCASQLAAATFAPAQVEAALAQIDALEAAIFARLYARAASTQAWMDRNRSVRELRRMVRPLHVQMRALLRHHPEFVTPAWF